MDLIRILNELWHRRLWVVAAACRGAAHRHLHEPTSFPPSKSALQLVGAATSQVLIDSSTSAIADVDRDPAR